MALFLPLFVNYCKIIAKKSGLWKSWQSHFGVLVLNHSSNNTVFCLHVFSESQKTVEECLYHKIIYCLIQNRKISLYLFWSTVLDF